MQETLPHFAISVKEIVHKWAECFTFCFNDRVEPCKVFQNSKNAAIELLSKATNDFHTVLSIKEVS